MTMNSIEDDRGIFGPDERMMMRETGINIIPGSADESDPDASMIAMRDASSHKRSKDVAPINLDLGLMHYPGEEPQNNFRSIAGTMQQIRNLSERITHTDANQHPMEVQRMAEKRDDLTRHLPDVF